MCEKRKRVLRVGKTGLAQIPVEVTDIADHQFRETAIDRRNSYANDLHALLE